MYKKYTLAWPGCIPHTHHRFSFKKFSRRSTNRSRSFGPVLGGSVINASSGRCSITAKYPKAAGVPCHNVLRSACCGSTQSRSSTWILKLLRPLPPAQPLFDIANKTFAIETSPFRATVRQTNNYLAKYTPTRTTVNRRKKQPVFPLAVFLFKLSNHFQLLRSHLPSPHSPVHR